MQIAYLDGERLRRALIVGSERLMEQAAQLNAINVFPVPDGDTGTNMASTARTMVLTLWDSARLPLGDALRAAADSALNGARGNSGAILAQFLHGLADELEHEVRITTRRFSEAARVASDRTKAALSRPREGTILTLLDDWSDAAARFSERSDDFLVVLKGAYEVARSSLARTKELLPELKKAGVVDAGAQGFFHVLEGIMGFIGSGRIRELLCRRERSESESSGAGSLDAVLAGAIAGAVEEDSGPYRYCTECFVSGEGGNLVALRASLEDLGDSLVLAGSDRRAKVHIHSDRPSAVFRVIGGYGELSGQKVDDMELQRRLAARPKPACALLVDSAGDLCDRDRLELGVERVPVQVEFGGLRYLDRDGLSSSEFYDLLRDSPDLHPSSSQPAPADFARKMDLLLSVAREIVYVGIAEALSGTLDAGRRSAKERTDLAGRPGAIRVVDSRSISIGTALVARRAAEAAASGASADEVVRVAEKIARAGRLFIAVPVLDGLIRSGRLSGIKSLALRTLGLRPLLTLDPEGRVKACGLYFGARLGLRAILSAMRKAIPAGAAIEAIVGHVDALGEAERLAAAIERRWRILRPIEISAVCPALSGHTGLGAVAVALMVVEDFAAGGVVGSAASGVAGVVDGSAASGVAGVVDDSAAGVVAGGVVGSAASGVAGGVTGAA